MNDLIYRQDAIEAAKDLLKYHGKDLTKELINYYSTNAMEQIPAAQPTLYGYRIEHLVYIARVMEKEGVTAEYAVKTFDNLGRALKMIIDETSRIRGKNHEAYRR